MSGVDEMNSNESSDNNLSSVNQDNNVDVVQAEAVKAEANSFFEKQNYLQAIALYTKAIELNPYNAVYYSNRSISNLRIENFGSALQDATKAIELDSSYTKGYYRRAAALMSLGRYKQALKDYAAVYKAQPDHWSKVRYTECLKLVKRVAFEKAIAVNDHKKSAFEDLGYESLTVPDSYTGPRLDGAQITEQFIIDLMEYYKNRGVLHKKYAYKILSMVKDFFCAQPSLVDVTIPDGSHFTVCGDIHGQFYDLLNIFELNGLPSVSNPYLFNGDFVDRGSFSVECIFTLFSFKLLYPDHFYMARGNHESETMNQMYGFEGEVKAKYSPTMVDLFTEVYNWLPLAHCLNNRVLVMHGGLFSEDGVTLNDIRNIDRNKQPPHEGIMCELLWSDPYPGIGRSCSKRGVGVQFGTDVTEQFCAENNLDYIIRSHEVKAMGYEVAHNGKCITVFSAPNYCDTMGNEGAYVRLDGKTLKPTFSSYSAVPHPDVKPMQYANSLLSLLS